MGELLHYQLTAVNTGKLPLRQIVLHDSVPEHSVLDPDSLSSDASYTGTGAGNVITWTTTEDLAPDEVLLRSFSVIPVTAGSVSNTAELSAADLPVAQISNSVVTTIMPLVEPPPVEPPPVEPPPPQQPPAPPALNPRIYDNGFE
jgi:uncharacterized repeat protein (TIGR01451 family)